MKQIELLKTLDDCIEMAAQVDSLHPLSKQMLLQKISTMQEFKKMKRGGPRAIERHPVLHNPALRLLIEKAYGSFDEEYTHN